MHMYLDVYLMRKRNSVRRAIFFPINIKSRFQLSGVDIGWPKSYDKVSYYTVRHFQGIFKNISKQIVNTFLSQLWTWDQFRTWINSELGSVPTLDQNENGISSELGSILNLESTANFDQFWTGNNSEFGSKLDWDQFWTWINYLFEICSFLRI